MKVLCIADGLIPADYITAGISSFPELAAAATVRTWAHPTIEDLQHDNLAVETGGPDAVCVPEEIFADVAEYDAIITQFCPVNSDVIARATKLRAIGVMRGGTENVDGAAAAAHGIKVVNTPGRNSQAVAEFAVGMILCETRDIARSQAHLRAGSWDRDFPNAAAIPEVEGKKIGIVGLGEIGRKVAAFLSAMGGRIGFYDPFFTGHTPYERYEDLAELAADADILTIHARLTPETHHLVSREVIAALKPNALLVNTARSGLVDEGALLDALEAGAIAGAAVDTFDDEPLPPDSRFLALDNVTITAHLAGSTIDAFRKTPALLAPRLLSVLNH